MFISEFARKTGVSVDTLRYYENIGLLPCIPRNNSGMRVYDDFVENRVRLIKALKNCGMSLKDMLLYIELLNAGEETIDKRKNILNQVKGRLLQKIAVMRAMVQNVELQF
ncbi:MAG: MerR family transcriptional regulator [Phascolarctobacterium sp.]|uniref:MerR family transcriptional regulator n=1 Tax=Phascolarctobacterium sp. TaxID=2049039 RepID=UPI0025F05CB0|nr:MerR family transcriptional regulator [Phascolarctobacterium sp.]MCC8157789.1 MerR family transcriptional regulator [Phascolarctobacterium sp.]